jgi:hypothetical protein
MGPLLRRGLSSSFLPDESCLPSAAGSGLSPKKASSDGGCFFVGRSSLGTDALLLAPAAVLARSAGY